MNRTPALALGLLAATIAADASARAYPTVAGLAAAADSSLTAANNPSGITRLEGRTFRLEGLNFSSESEWDAELPELGLSRTTKDSGNTFVPRIFWVEPITEDLTFSFTMLGAGFSEDFGNWEGRYIITSYDSILASAFPSLAYRINDQWSVAGSVSISYSSFEQESAVRNFLDPGFGDGKSEIETDSVEFGFGLSALYEMNDRTRFGLNYTSEIESERDGDFEFSGLGPNTGALIDGLGLSGIEVTVEGVSPQSVVVGMYHEFEDSSAITLDVAWIDFSSFVLSEYYFDGTAVTESDAEYRDIWAFTASYTWPVNERWSLGVGAAVTNNMIEDDKRTILLRPDAIWGLGVAAEWKWTETRTVNMALSYLDLGKGEVSTDPIEGVGPLVGEYSERYALLAQFAVSFGK